MCEENTHPQDLVVSERWLAPPSRGGKIVGPPLLGRYTTLRAMGGLAPQSPLFYTPGKNFFLFWGGGFLIPFGGGCDSRGIF